MIEEKIYLEIEKELIRAEAKYPNFPNDIVDQAAIVCEESGELIREALKLKFETGSVSNLKKECIQTAVVAIRMLKNLD